MAPLKRVCLFDAGIGMEVVQESSLRGNDMWSWSWRIDESFRKYGQEVHSSMCGMRKRKHIGYSGDGKKAENLRWK